MGNISATRSFMVFRTIWLQLYSGEPVTQVQAGRNPSNLPVVLILSLTWIREISWILLWHGRLTTSVSHAGVPENQTKSLPLHFCLNIAQGNYTAETGSEFRFTFSDRHRCSVITVVSLVFIHFILDI